jgi:hypothetical protein
VLDYKDALYADRVAARHLSGAFRLIWEDGALRVHVQLARGAIAPDDLSRRLLRALPGTLGRANLTVWPHDAFPFGMGLDYERKFEYYVATE